ncbi:hypothetical protein Tcan_06688 [Toxocara canis]|uniref:Uncharacterized protein n=1 Tax=Toxocara canis TaxID=6265 RepID=A0A0B2V9M6_TOXCA|nr:hypothetical protein Tcan_06688 [Toxocara canis]
MGLLMANVSNAHSHIPTPTSTPGLTPTRCGETPTPELIRTPTPISPSAATTYANGDDGSQTFSVPLPVRLNNSVFIPHDAVGRNGIHEW